MVAARSTKGATELLSAGCTGWATEMERRGLSRLGLCGRLLAWCSPLSTACLRSVERLRGLQSCAARSERPARVHGRHAPLVVVPSVMVAVHNCAAG